jgi:maltose O-acetyltransferase
VVSSERDRMLAGEPYDPNDPELVQLRARSVERCRRLLAIAPSDGEARRALLVELFKRGGDTVGIHPPFWCDYGVHIELGSRVFFNFDCVVLDVCPVRIGSYTQFGPAVQIYTATHPLDAALRRLHESGRPVTIGEDVWVGGGAIILPGVTIGSRTVIGAGSVVTRDVPDDVVAAGNPCRVIRRLAPGEPDHGS